MSTDTCRPTPGSDALDHPAYRHRPRPVEGHQPHEAHLGTKAIIDNVIDPVQVVFTSLPAHEA